MATTYLAIIDPTSAAGQYFRDHSLHDGLTQIDSKCAPLIQCQSIEYKDGMATLNRRPGVKVPRFTGRPPVTWPINSHSRCEYARHPFSKSSTAPTW